MSTQTSPKVDVYQKVTDLIVSQLEQGVRPWMKTWKGTTSGGIERPLRADGTPYRGVNVLILWTTAMERGYSSSMWMTFKQAIKAGACVRKGEKGTMIVYFDSVTRTKTDAETGEDVEKKIPLLKGYTVFNVEQIDGLPTVPAAPAINQGERIANAEAFFANVGVNICHGGDRAFYMPSTDRVQMPLFESFIDPESYYGTLAHEVSHWTSHKSRLDRDFGRKRFGDDGYAIEELVAELGAAFLSADLGLSPAPRAEHASYLAGWLKVLKNDKRAIFTAATHAQKAADFLHGLQPANDPEEAEMLEEAA